MDEDGCEKLGLFQQLDLFGIRDEAEGIENLLLDGLQRISWIVGLQIELLCCGRNSSILFDTQMIRWRKGGANDYLQMGGANGGNLSLGSGLSSAS